MWHHFRLMATVALAWAFSNSDSLERHASPGVIAQAITAKALAIQQSERAQNELATTRAEAARKIAEAEDGAKSAVTRAQGEADANRILQNSLTPQLLELRRLENQRVLIERLERAIAYG